MGHEGVFALPRLRAFALFRFDLRRPAPDELRPCRLRAIPETVETFAVGADVHVQHGHIGDAVIESLVGVLDGVHAAEARAVTVMAAIPRADAQDEEDLVRVRAVGGPHDLAARRAGGIDEPLKLHRGHDIGRGAVAVFLQRARIEHVVAHGHDDRADLAGKPLLSRHEIINGLRGTGHRAAVAGQVVGRIVEAGIHINEIGPRRGLGDGRIDRLARRHAGIVFVGEHLRTDEGTFAAAGAGAGDITRALSHRHAEIARLTLHALHFRQRENLDVGMEIHLRHLGRFDADGTVERREVLVEHRHHPADGGLAFDKHHLRARLRQIQRRLNPRDPPADDHYGIAHGWLPPSK